MSSYDSWLAHNPADDYDEKQLDVTVYCGRCDEEFDDVTVDAAIGRSTITYSTICPRCTSPIEGDMPTEDRFPEEDYERPEPDFD